MSATYEARNENRFKSQMCKKKSLSAILIVDDDPDFLDLVCEHVSQIDGVEIEVATSLENAVSRLAHRGYQLVICDWRLASRTGPEVFCMADPLTPRRSKEKMPVMFMSCSEKVACVQSLSELRNFEPVTFILKNLGARMIRIMAENVLHFRNSSPCERGNFGASRIYQ